MVQKRFTMAEMQEFLRLQAENMKLLNEQLHSMQTQLLNISSQNINSTSGPSQLSHVPWPKPLQVESGDIRENYELFKSNWNTYVIATGMDKWAADREPQKVNILLSIIGDTAKMKYNSFGLTDADKVDVAQVLAKIDDKLVTKKHPMYERWQFHTCNQLDNESFDAYLVRLTKISDNCQFDKIDS